MASLGVARPPVRAGRGVPSRQGAQHPEPGMRFMIPLVDRMRKVSLRAGTMPIVSQRVITTDNVSLGVAAMAYHRRDRSGGLDRGDRERTGCDPPRMQRAIQKNSTIVFPAQL